MLFLKSSTKRKPPIRLFQIIILVLIGILLLSSTAAWAQAEPRRAGDLHTPIEVELTIDNVPPLGGTATLICHVSSVLDAPGTTAQIELPPGVRLTAGDLTWQGDLTAGETVTLTASVVFDVGGDLAIFCRALRPLNATESWGDLDQVYVSISAGQGRMGFAPIAPQERDVLGGMEAAGEGRVVSANNFYPSPSAFGASAPDVAPPAAQPQRPGAAREAVDNTDVVPRGPLTVTGRFRYYNRNDALASEQFIIQIVRGDNSAHLAWCYNDVNGYFSCGPFNNPGAAGVRARMLSYTSFNPYNDILVTVNPSWGTVGNTTNAYGTTTSVQVFADGVRNIGAWFVTNNATYERAYWVTADLIEVWKYVYFGTGASQVPVETTGRSTVEWRIDSTDGTYYSLGGNIHLDGTDPLSSTVVGHEYGHNIMYTVYGNTYPPTPNCSPHSIPLVSSAGCAWTEGWATFISMAANNDVFYRWDSGATINLETPTWGTSGWQNGDTVEGRVSGALWDILDSANEGEDQYSDGGITRIWDTFYHQNDNTFSEFWAAWRSRGHPNTSAGPIMSIWQSAINYRLGPSNDDFTGRLLVGALPYSLVNLNTANATTQRQDPNTACGSSSTRKQSRSVWFQYTPGVSNTYLLHTNGSNYDTVLSVYTGTFGSLVSRGCNDDGGTGLQSLLTVTMNAGTTYYIQVANYSSGNGGLLSLYIDRTYLPAPVLVSPANPSTTTVKRPTFKWAKVTGAKKYEFALSEINPPVAIRYFGTKRSFRPPALLTGTYYWRVRPVDRYGNTGLWSETRQITIISAPSDAAIGYRFTTSTPTLPWSRVSWAANYQLQVSADNRFRTSQYSGQVDAGTLSATTAPLENGIWYWRVRAQRPDGSWGPWSETGAFSVEAPLTDSP